jgi:hypothetical protein
MTTKNVLLCSSPKLLPLPELVGRVAVLGGTASDKSNLVVGLAVRQARQQGTIFCLDARRHQQVELQFRLLLRQRAQYTQTLSPGEVSAETAKHVLSAISRSLSEQSLPPLLLCDSMEETTDWERTIQFLLKAGATIAEILTSPAALIFGRYDTVLLLRESGASADALSRAVGRKVSAEDIDKLKSGEGWLVHLTQVHHVQLPGIGDK